MKQLKPVLLIDQDDVLAEYIKAVTEAFNKKYNTQHKPSDCIRWDLVSIFGEDIIDIMHDEQLFRQLEPVENALEVFERLYRSELFEMYIVTAAHPTSVAAKFEWLKEHMPYLPQKNVIVSSAKYMIKGDYLLDDGMHNIAEFKAVGGKAIVFDRPHNQHGEDGDARIKSWIEFEQYIVEACYPERVESYFAFKTA